METTTETSQTNRELTPTEIKIAIAQIEDRLMRVAKAQAELTEFCGQGERIEYNRMMEGVSDEDSNDESERIINDKRSKLRAKYEIPAGVFLFYEDWESALHPLSAKECMPYLSAWVKGKLTEEQISDLYYYFEEFDQADWGWIMLERPIGYYGCPSDDDNESVFAEMKSIGTRLRTKNKKLQPMIPKNSGWNR